MSVVDRSFDHPLKLEERAVSPLAGGIMQHGYQCGMIWGAALAAGAQAYRLHGPSLVAQAQAMAAAEKLVDAFRARNGTINCSEIVESTMQTSREILRFLIKGGPIRCFRMAARYAPEALGQIGAALSAERITTPLPPLSCSALLAQRTGASDMHTVMAAGLAGGIGLRGGGCGALGAAIWIIGMNTLKNGGKVGFKIPQTVDAIDRFLKCTDYRFECSEIVGRRFENVADHAEYLRGGGCSRIIDVLATE